MGGNKLVVLSVVLVLAFIGCTLPPSPSSPGLSGEDSGLVGFAFRNLNFNEKSLEQFSPPIDPFDGDRVIYSIYDQINIGSSGTNTLFGITGAFILPNDEEPVAPPRLEASQKIDAYHPNGYIWGTAYYLNNERFAWEEIKLRGDRVGNSNWIDESSYGDSYYLDPYTLVEGENYIIAYSCKEYDGEWKCGCRDTQDSCNRWMLQSFEVIKEDLPPGPGNPPEVADPEVIERDIDDWDFLAQYSKNNCYPYRVDGCRASVGQYDYNVGTGLAEAMVTTERGFFKNGEYIDLLEDYRDEQYEEGYAYFPETILGNNVYKLVSPNNKYQNHIGYFWYSGGQLIAVEGHMSPNVPDRGNALLPVAVAYLELYGSDLEFENFATCYDADDIRDDIYVPSVTFFNRAFEDGEIIEIDHIIQVKDTCSSGQLSEFYCQSNVAHERIEECNCVSGYCVHPRILQNIDGMKINYVVDEYEVEFPDNPPTEGYQSSYENRNSPLERTHLLFQKHEKIIEEDGFLELMDDIFDEYEVRNSLGSNYYFAEEGDRIFALWYSGDFFIAVISHYDQIFDDFQVVVESYIDAYGSDVDSDNNDGGGGGPGVKEKVFIKSENDKLEIGEALFNATEMLTQNDLKALASGFLDNRHGSFEYNQYIKFNETALQYVDFAIDDDDDFDIPADHLYIKSGHDIFIYELEFQEAAESDITDANGNLDPQGDTLYDFIDETLFMMGKSYTIVKAERTAGLNAHTRFILLSGQILDTLKEGQTRTYRIDEKDYEVSALIIDDSVTPFTVKLKINGDVTRKLEEGETDTMSDGLEVGIRNILKNEPGDVSQDLVEFYLSVDELIIKDADIMKSGGGTLEVNDETINDADVEIVGTDDNTQVKIEKIRIRLAADDDLYVAQDTGVSEQLDEPEGFFTQNFDIVFDGKVFNEFDEVAITSLVGSDYTLSFTNGKGILVSVPLVSRLVGRPKMGSPANGLGIVERRSTSSLLEATFPILDNDYFIVNNNEPLGQKQDGITYVLQYKGLDSTDNVIKFKEISSGDVFEVDYEESDDLITTQFQIAGHTYLVEISVDLDDSAISVDLDGDGSIDIGESPYIVTKHGPYLRFVDSGNFNGIIDGEIFTLAVTTDSSLIEEAIEDEIVNIHMKYSNNQITVNYLDAIALQMDDDIPIVKDHLTGYARHFQNGMHRVGDGPNREEISTYGIEFLQYGSNSNLRMSIPKIQKEVLVSVVVN